MTTTAGASSTRARRKALTAEIDRAVAGWVEAGLIDGTEWMQQGRRPLLETPLPAGPGVWFDLAAVERVLAFFLMLKQTIGRRHAGQPFRLMDWQVRYLIAPVFGLKRADGLRCIRTVWFEIPRKNGKSTLCSGLGLYLFAADREPGAEVYCVASARDQAAIVFDASREMAAGCKPLARRLGQRGIQRRRLIHPKTHSVFRVLSSDGMRQHGLNVHGGVIDEVHAHENSDVIDAVETGIGARDQPVLVFITTADDGGTGTAYATKREEIEALAGGHAEDSSVYGVVFGADDSAADFDPYSEDTLKAANPGFGVTVLADYLMGRAAQAQRSPAQLNRFLRLHLNVRTKQEIRWLKMDDWDGSARRPRSNIPVPVELDELEGRTCYGGLDLSSTTDMTAFSLWFPPVDPVDDTEPHVWVPFFWLPEDRIKDLERTTKVPLGRWSETPAHAGPALRLTEGGVVDYRAVRALITDELAPRFDIRSVGYDRWNAAETAKELETSGLVMDHVAQGYAGMNEPCKQLERLVLARRVSHGGHPILRWHVDCVGIRQNGDGYVKPVKPDRRVSSKRIDGVASGLNALSQWLGDRAEEEAPEPNIRIITA
ncbi:terminase large subunit [Streptomyces sp. 3MP-14]|uniref:Terminase large subunit n=1 Tax=Streptomyces mimosae TaxID=2586635 RepID=A0A5N6AFV6_9ACTN|nr:MULTISPECIES: terminase TerL endonuclease subunit [Streptomyces]KAB8167052.1 terminase large subunit [Streptomyces mimosae]KAB8176993.1 terminase large subunit [Streptomyces sp. 3MP-14]